MPMAMEARRRGRVDPAPHSLLLHLVPRSLAREAKTIEQKAHAAAVGKGAEKTKMNALINQVRSFDSSKCTDANVLGAAHMFYDTFQADVG